MTDFQHIRTPVETGWAFSWACHKPMFIERVLTTGASWELREKVNANPGHRYVFWVEHDLAFGSHACQGKCPEFMA